MRVSTQTRPQIENQKLKIEVKMRTYSDALDHANEVVSDVGELLATIDTLEREIESLRTENAELDGRVNDLESELEEAQKGSDG